MEKEKEIGKVIHWYNKASVAVVKLSDSLAVGEHIKVVRGESTFECPVESMQVDHKEVRNGKAGTEVAIKLSQEAKQGARLYKM